MSDLSPIKALGATLLHSAAPARAASLHPGTRVRLRNRPDDTGVVIGPGWAGRRRQGALGRAGRHDLHRRTAAGGGVMCGLLVFIGVCCGVIIGLSLSGIIRENEETS